MVKVLCRERYTQRKGVTVIPTAIVLPDPRLAEWDRIESNWAAEYPEGTFCLEPGCTGEPVKKLKANKVDGVKRRACRAHVELIRNHTYDSPWESADPAVNPTAKAQAPSLALTPAPAATQVTAKTEVGIGGAKVYVSVEGSPDEVKAALSSLFG